MKEKMGDKQRLLHIFDAILEVESYIKGFDITVFSSNSMARFATIKQLEIIGEASNHLSEELKEKYSSVEWKKIVGLRHILVHEYFGIDDILVWQIANHDLRVFKSTIESIIKDFTE